MRSRLPYRTILILAAATLSWTAATHAQDAATAPNDALLKRIDALETEVKELREQQRQAADPKLDRHTVDSTVDAVLEDARRRSSVVQFDTVSASYTDGRFLLRTADGNFQLHPWLQFQYRNVTNFRHDGKQDGENDDTENGFEVRRLKFGIDGNVVTPNLTYTLQLAVDRKTGNTNLEMMWLKYHFVDSPFAVRAGQFKDPLDHEQLASSRFFAPVERTIVNDIFANGENFVKGVSLLYEPGEKQFRSEVAFTDGMRNFNQNFEDYPNLGNASDWGVAGRAEYKPFGRWRDYDKLAAAKGQDQTLVFGGGADYTEAGSVATLVHVLDAEYLNPSGLMLYGAYLGRYTKDNNLTGGGTGDTYDPTLRALASFAIDQHWEPYVEYSYIHFDDSTIAAGANPNVHMITAGTAYYLFHDNLKLQIDLSYLPNGSPVNDDGAGILQDNHSNEFILRSQFQLLL